MTAIDFNPPKPSPKDAEKIRVIEEEIISYWQTYEHMHLAHDMARWIVARLNSSEEKR